MLARTKAGVIFMGLSRNFRHKILVPFLICGLLGLVACQEAKKSDNKDGTLTEQEKTDQAQKKEELRQRENARHRGMNVENRRVQILDVSSSRLSLRLLLGLNNRPTSIVYSMPLDTGSSEQFDIQDKTSEISKPFPAHNLEISAYKFKAGTVDMLALEYRFLRLTAQHSESSSQFVLLILDPTLGDKAVLKTHFEFPTRSILKQWARTAKQADNSSADLVTHTTDGEL